MVVLCPSLISAHRKPDPASTRFLVMSPLRSSTSGKLRLIVVNHGVSEELLNDTMKVVTEFFEMPMEEKASLYSQDPNEVCKLYTSNTNYDTENFHFWRDALKHPCHPLEACIQLWPQKMTRYSLTLGLPKHCDPNLITILLQGSADGLQVFKDGQWLGVGLLPNALVVNIGHQLQIVSNNKLKSAEHRVTNSKVARNTVGLFISSRDDCIIQPAKSLTSEAEPPLYKPFRYKDFLSYYISMMGDTESALQPFKLPSNQC
ncbi:putative 2-oxoglutarate and Fe(II)-dependent oxygenase superfamily protein [Hibiscus syriacus]|uniref:2-oxoglutarate and Fe(II)-dependent oxygenase superfamily protein n=1 Tax=Hibiscus syriacus TaxID=106335 RepID=A0A6A2WMS5_HIBSY|nr:putative 2-oxoglutarate and Fe(II)-dependent oxygenase superfamily protein [Hibiscus syriacus]